MKTAKKMKVTGAILAVIALALTIFAFTIPRDYHYQKQADIIAQQRMVFVFIGELQRWPEWTKWTGNDPDKKNACSEPSWGVGASCRLPGPTGEDGVKVTGFTKGSYMAYDLISSNWEPSKWEFKLGPAPRQGTTVVWSVTGQFPENRFMRLIAYIWLWSLPADIQQGLERLKKHAELHEAYSVKGGWE